VHQWQERIRELKTKTEKTIKQEGKDAMAEEK
jgi:hypothetical protein